MEGDLRCYRVVLTAFGPFEGVPVNPTQELLESILTTPPPPPTMSSSSNGSKSSGGGPYLETTGEGCRLVVLETSAEGAMETLRAVWGHQHRDDDDQSSGGGGGGGGVLFVHLGVDSSATDFHLECQAFNEADFRCPDMRGHQPCRAAIVPHAPHCLTTDIDVDALVRHLRGEGWPVSRSEDAGRYVCNYVYYQSLYQCRQRQQQANTPTTHPSLRGGGSTTTTQEARGGGGGPRWRSLFVHVPPASVAPLPRQRAFLAALLAALGPAAALPVHPAALPPALHHHPKAAGEDEQQEAPLVDGGDDVASASSSSSSSALVSSIQDMGFTRSQAEAAVRVLGPQAGLELAIDWLLETGGTEEAVQQALLAASDSSSSMMMMEEEPVRCKMVLLVRQDLGMSCGKIAAQCCHAALAAYQSCVEEGRYGDAGRAQVLTWQGQGEPVIALRVPDLHTMLQLEEQARRAGAGPGGVRLPVARVQDAGRTQVQPGSLTVLALGPAPCHVIDPITRHLKLL